MLKKFSVGNLAANWYVPLSALVLFVMQSQLMVLSYVEAVIAFIAWIIFCACVPSTDMWKPSSESGIVLKIYSWLTALGVCMFTHTYLYERMQTRPEQFTKLLRMLHISERLFSCGLFAVSLLALVFVYMCAMYFWRKFLTLIKSSGAFRGIGRTEFVFYVILFAVSVAFVTVVFLRTDAPYKAAIYSSDSSTLVGRNCFLNIAHGQNDTRQALFGVFALPFMGVPYLLGRIVAIFAGHRELMTALSMNYAQIAMLLAGIFFLTKSMGLSPFYRAIFALCFTCTYTYLLALLMMEQYIVAFFWCTLCIYFVCHEPQPDRMILYGAGGTLTTSLIFTPFYLVQGGGYLHNLFRMALEFLGLMLLFSRASVIYNLFSHVIFLLRFTGIGENPVPFISRLAQYSEFLYGIFFSPNAVLDAGKNPSWGLYPATNINYIGLAILALSILGAVINWRKKICRISFMWIVYSFVILCALGWGTAENGLILYTLYFSWAFYVLVFMLALRVKILVPLLAVGAVIIFVCSSFPAIRELVAFGIKYYPFAW